MDWIPQVQKILEDYCGKWGTRIIAYILIGCLVFWAIDLAHPGFQLVYEFFVKIQTPTFREIVASNWFSIVATGLVASVTAGLAFSLGQRLLIYSAYRKLRAYESMLDDISDELREGNEESYRTLGEIRADVRKEAEKLERRAVEIEAAAKRIEQRGSDRNISDSGRCTEDKEV